MLSGETKDRIGKGSDGFAEVKEWKQERTHGIAPERKTAKKFVIHAWEFCATNNFKMCRVNHIGMGNFGRIVCLIRRIPGPKCYGKIKFNDEYYFGLLLPDIPYLLQFLVFINIFYCSPRLSSSKSFRMNYLLINKQFKSIPFKFNSSNIIY